MNQSELKEILIYDADTGVFVWSKNIGRKTKKGDIAGCLHKFGYIKIRHKGKQYCAHRLAWLYVYGVLPSKLIDHKNGVRSDNRIDNLRNASWSENMKNKSIQSNNKSGFKGVFWNTRAAKWSSKCQSDKVRQELGFFDVAEVASAAYINCAKELHGEFYKSI